MKIVKKPWGSETIWAHTKDYVGKILFINKDQRLSLQYHREKDETIFVLKGTMMLYYSDQEIYGEKDQYPLKSKTMNVGDSFHIKPGVVHQMAAQTDCEILEASTDHLDDVVRLEDDYGRV